MFQVQNAKRVDRTRTTAPFVSVVMPVRNEEHCLGELLRQLLSQDYDPRRFEVIVADGRSEDATRSIVRELMAWHANLRLVDNERRLASSGRNLAVRSSVGDLIVIVDGHCRLPGPNYLRSVVSAFERSGADCLGRPQPLETEDRTLLQEAIGVARSCWLGHHPSSFIYESGERFVPPQSAAVAYRRHLFERFGLFDETFDACEDVEFNQRLADAGVKCFFSESIGVSYAPRRSLTGLLRQMFRYGQGRVRLLGKHPRTFSLASVLPLFCLVLAVGALGGAVWLPALVAWWLAGLGCYGAIVLATSLALCGRLRCSRSLLWLPFVFMAIHLGVAVGSLVGAASLPFWKRTPTPNLEPRESRQLRSAA